MDFGEKILRGLNRTTMAPGDYVGADKAPAYTAE